MRMPRSTTELKQSLSNATYNQIVAVSAFIMACAVNAMSDQNNPAALLLTGLAAFGIYTAAMKPQAQSLLKGVANKVLPQAEEPTKTSNEINQPQPK